MDLDMIRRYNVLERLHEIKRTDIISNLYQVNKEALLKEWVSMEDIVKVKFLEATIGLNSNGLKYAVYDKENKNPVQYALKINDYPYDVKSNIQHLVLWSLKVISPEEIDIILKQELKDVKDMCWIEQKDNYKSVKGIWHVHVFVEH